MVDDSIRRPSFSSSLTTEKVIETYVARQIPPQKKPMTTPGNAPAPVRLPVNTHRRYCTTVNRSFIARPRELNDDQFRRGRLPHVRLQELRHCTDLSLVVRENQRNDRESIPLLPFLLDCIVNLTCKNIR